MIQPEYLISPTSQATATYCSCRLFVYYQKDQHYTDYEYRSSLLGHVIRDEFWSVPVLHCHHLFMIPFGCIHWEFNIFGIPLGYGYIFLFLQHWGPIDPSRTLITRYNYPSISTV